MRASGERGEKVERGKGRLTVTAGILLKVTLVVMCLLGSLYKVCRCDIGTDDCI